jgi:hypothetical protein
MPCNLKAALVPTAGAHCNITDICLAVPRLATDRK